MYKIKDSDNKLIYEGSDGVDLFKILNGTEYDVSENDEVRFGELLHTSWTGKLRLLEYTNDGKLIVNIKFKGIDDWNRPVFKDIIRALYFGSVKTLFNDNATENEVLKYLKDNMKELEYFGDSFGCEPHGGLNPNIELRLNVIDENV